MIKIESFIDIARPYQYIKNAFVFLPIFFANKIQDLGADILTFWAFVAFCLAASSVYILNDLQDLEEDRAHPRKKNRPLASGALSVMQAVSFMAFLLGAAILISLTLLPGTFFLVIAAYLLLNTLYSFSLKHFAILDIVCIGVGFVLRVFGGGIAANVEVSHWIILMTFLLALFLALAKRRDDLLILSANSGNVRKSLDGYSLEFVSAAMVIMASVVIVSYILYTVSSEVILKHRVNNLYLTSIWVVIGLLRYLQLALVEQRTGSPTLIVLKDRFIQVVILLWLGTFAVLFYGRGLIDP